MKLTLAGVSHHKAPIELRERVALDLDACQALAERFDGEAVVLSTAAGLSSISSGMTTSTSSRSER